MTGNDISPHEQHQPTYSYNTCPSLTYWHLMVLLLLILCCDDICCVTAFWFAINANGICLVYMANFVCMLSDSSVNFSDMSFEIQISILWFLRTYHIAQDHKQRSICMYICTYIIHILLYASKVSLALSVCNISYYIDYVQTNKSP